MIGLCVAAMTFKVTLSSQWYCFRMQLSAAVVRHRANDGVVYAIRAWFKYGAALSAVVTLQQCSVYSTYF